MSPFLPSAFAGLRSDYQRMSKPREIEEVWDIYLIRPAGFLLVQLFRRTPITPNGVSALAILAGWWSAYYFYRAGAAGNAARYSCLAAALLFLHSALDSADGQLARVTGKGSAWGRTIDGISDNLAFIGVYFGVLLGHYAYVV